MSFLILRLTNSQPGKFQNTSTNLAPHSSTFSFPQSTQFVIHTSLIDLSMSTNLFCSEERLVWVRVLLSPTSLPELVKRRADNQSSSTSALRQAVIELRA
ncbi:hypothetical protein BLNAU_9232 [Blattamonas nauphoetae]|uniref:Uncharacterized protein n=1 Tax=Blattamonas nauphoetae TaxID=2049346 RepID=A0ABQ9XWN1_9EUKA|nr:hypothetical protein BLNAU_9232 [Blattamonas nauphoetae]